MIPTDSDTPLQIFLRSELNAFVYDHRQEYLDLVTREATLIPVEKERLHVLFCTCSRLFDLLDTSFHTPET